MGGVVKPKKSIGKRTREELWENGGVAQEGHRWASWQGNMRHRVRDYVEGQSEEYSSDSDGEDGRTDATFLRREAKLDAEREGREQEL